jgi:hypothetical protein
VGIERILRDFGLILGAGLVSQLIATIIRIPQITQLHQDHHHYLPEVGKVPGIETVERPVTVPQLTATKNALTREIPSFVAHGSSSNAVPRHERQGPVHYEL